MIFPDDPHVEDDDVPMETDVRFGANVHHAGADFNGQALANRIAGHAHEAVHHPDPSVVAAGNRVADNILTHINSVMEPAAKEGAHDPGGDLKFGAGTCGHCSGLGYTTWASSGSQERCWYCNGSGVRM